MNDTDTCLKFFIKFKILFKFLLVWTNWRFFLYGKVLLSFLSMWIVSSNIFHLFFSKIVSLDILYILEVLILLSDIYWKHSQYFISVFLFCLWLLLCLWCFFFYRILLLPIKIIYYFIMLFLLCNSNCCKFSPFPVDTKIHFLKVLLCKE